MARSQRGNLLPHRPSAKGQVQCPTIINCQDSAAVAGLSSSKHLLEAVQEEVSPQPKLKGSQNPPRSNVCPPSFTLRCQESSCSPMLRKAGLCCLPRTNHFPLPPFTYLHCLTLCAQHPRRALKPNVISHISKSLPPPTSSVCQCFELLNRLINTPPAL